MRSLRFWILVLAGLLLSLTAATAGPQPLGVCSDPASLIQKRDLDPGNGEVFIRTDEQDAAIDPLLGVALVGLGSVAACWPLVRPLRSRGTQKRAARRRLKRHRDETDASGLGDFLGITLFEPMRQNGSHFRRVAKRRAKEAGVACQVQKKSN